MKNKLLTYLSIIALLFCLNAVSFAESLGDKIIKTSIYKKYTTEGFQSANNEFNKIKQNKTIRELDYIVMMHVCDQENRNPYYFEVSNEALKKYPKSQTIYALIGIKYERLKQEKKAINSYTKSIKIKPTEPAHYNRARLYYSQKNYKRAIADYSQALKYINEYAKTNEKNVALSEIYYCRGLAYDKLGNFDAAITDFDSAVKYNSKNLELLYNRALIKIYKLNNKKTTKEIKAKLINELDSELDILLKKYKDAKDKKGYNKTYKLKEIVTLKLLTGNK